MKPVKLSVLQWDAIREDIKKAYPPSVFLMRDRMRSVLGFTDRTHRDWIDNPKADYEWDRGHWAPCIMLDFYDERKRTMFLLKYSEQLNETQVS